MDNTIASLSGNLNRINANTFDLKTWIQLGGSIGTILAAIFAWRALIQSNKQLEIEQTPYIVLDHICRVGDRFGFAVKNIGKGPALNITFSLSKNISNRNDPFFSEDQPHSANFRSMEESHYWKVDTNRLESLTFRDGFAFLYAFFESQSGKLFMTKVKIKKIGEIPNHKYIVMENQFPV